MTLTEYSYLYSMTHNHIYVQILLKNAENIDWNTRANFCAEYSSTNGSVQM